MNSGNSGPTGVSGLEEMSEIQKQAVVELMSASLSAKGLELSFDIMKTDRTLREINDNSFIYGEEKYFFTVMGIPSATEPWGWQLDGHHMVINYFVLADQVVVTPMFLGGEPVVTTTGHYKGNAILQTGQNLGLSLRQSLDAEQRKAAVIRIDKSPTDLVASVEPVFVKISSEFQRLPGRAACCGPTAGAWSK